MGALPPPQLPRRLPLRGIGLYRYVPYSLGLSGHIPGPLLSALADGPPVGFGDVKTSGGDSRSMAEVGLCVGQTAV